MIPEIQQALEREVLNLLLRGDHPVLSALRAQRDQVRGKRREMTGCGFYVDFELPASTPGVHEHCSTKPNFELGGVEAVLYPQKQKAGFLLFIREGRLRFLEGYVYDDEMVPTIERFEVEYMGEGRDIAELERAWSLEAQD